VTKIWVVGSFRCGSITLLGRYHYMIDEGSIYRCAKRQLGITLQDAQQRTYCSNRSSRPLPAFLSSRALAADQLLSSIRNSVLWNLILQDQYCGNQSSKPRLRQAFAAGVSCYCRFRKLPEVPKISEIVNYKTF